MRAALAQQLSGIDSVELGELPDPAPAAGQALIRVHGAGVGPWDVGFLGGGFPGLALPFVPGQEVAGLVEAVGDGAAVVAGTGTYDTRESVELTERAAAAGCDAVIACCLPSKVWYCWESFTS